MFFPDLVGFQAKNIDIQYLQIIYSLHGKVTLGAWLGGGEGEKEPQQNGTVPTWSQYVLCPLLPDITLVLLTLHGPPCTAEDPTYYIVLKMFVLCEKQKSLMRFLNSERSFT